MIAKFKRWLSHNYHALMALKDDKKSIARGVGIAVFWGFTPLFGFKTLLTLLTAWLTRANKVAAMITIALHEVLLPIYPFYLEASYRVGSWLVGRRHPLTIEKLLHIMHHAGLWKSEATLLWPTLIGSMILGIPPAVIAYVVTLWLIERKMERAKLTNSEKVAPDQQS